MQLEHMHYKLPGILHNQTILTPRKVGLQDSQALMPGEILLGLYRK